jgi:hypothetical protein
VEEARPYSKGFSARGLMLALRWCLGKRRKAQEVGRALPGGAVARPRGGTCARREGGPADEPQPELSVSAKHSRVAWARLIKKLRSRSLGRQQVEDLREPAELPPLSQTHEGYRRHHRLRAGPQDPATPHQDRQATPPVWIPPP